MSGTHATPDDDAAHVAGESSRRDVPAKIIALARAVRDAGGRALLVGGCVRDHLMGRESKDWDTEVYGIEPAVLRELLGRFGRVNTVGEAFTVYKLGRNIDVSIPRRERKQGRGHRGFVIEGDPSMSVEEAARRRDFTINAILQDPLTNEIIDPFDGQKDLRDSVLRHVAAETFVEDSLRVLRGAQFAARFSLTIDADTLALCRSIRLDDLPSERVWGELEKLLLQAPQPSIGLRLLAEMNATAQLFPELYALDAQAEAHTFRTVDGARTLVDDLPYARRVAVMLAAVCHEFGGAGVEGTERFLERLKIYTLDNYDVRAQTLALVRERCRPFELYEARDEETIDARIRRLALSCELELLYRVALAGGEDSSSVDSSPEAAEWFITHARALGVSERPLPRLLTGADLIEMNLRPSPRFGELIAAVYEMQLDGRVHTHEEAKEAARGLLTESATMVE